METRVIAIIFWCSIAVLAVAPVRALAQEELATYSTRQDAPCPGQAASVQELVSAFEAGQFPAASHLSGTWVAIGFVDRSPSLNCDGVIRGPAFEWVLVADQDSIVIDMIGMPLQTRFPKPDARQSMTFPVDFGGDGLPEYRCRLTNRRTLACLSGEGEWLHGIEFSKMVVRQDQRASHYPTHPYPPQDV